MTYSEMCSRLRDAGIENYHGEARILAEEICGEFSENKDFGDPRLDDAVNRRCGGFPLQYIIGKWWFCRCEFEVDENCLIPRPDTELIVELAQKKIRSNGCFADLCTGSGCIAVSLLDLREDLKALAVDLYPKTLDIAIRNAEKNKVSSRFSSMLGDVLSPDLLGNEKFDSIISNPPYIRRDVIPTLSKEVSYEPLAALDGGDDGLLFYRAILDNFEKNLEPDGFFLFEIGYDQASDMRELAASRGFECIIYRDLGGNDRAALLCRKK